MNFSAIFDSVWLGLIWPVIAFISLNSITVFAQMWLASKRPSPTGSPTRSSDTVKLRTTVLIPAHNEAAGIERTLASVTPQLGPHDEILVVADNCSDDTATVARQAGARVVERHDQSLRGKGYALAHGVAAMADAPPTHVLILDADCTLHPGSLRALLHACEMHPGPVQACDLMQTPAGGGVATRIAEFAWLVKNDLRPAGSQAIGWPCQLMGTGMVFPWHLLAEAPLATGHLAEDMQLGIHVAQQGHFAHYCRTALVTSQFPTQAKAQIAQRQRWEHGHLNVIVAQALPTLQSAVRKLDWRLFGMALDLMVLPLAALFLAHLVLLTLLFAGWTAGLNAATMTHVVLASLGLLTLAVGRAWWLGGREVVTWIDLLRLPVYVLSKLSIYANYFARKEATWVRASRDGDSDRVG